MNRSKRKKQVIQIGGNRRSFNKNEREQIENSEETGVKCRQHVDQVVFTNPPLAPIHSRRRLRRASEITASPGPSRTVSTYAAMDTLALKPLAYASVRR